MRKIFIAEKIGREAYFLPFGFCKRKMAAIKKNAVTDMGAMATWFKLAVMILL